MGFYSNRDLELLDEAIAAVEDVLKWQAIEDDRFARYFRGELHGNSVRQAERARDRRSYVAIDAVFALRTYDERIAEATVDVCSDECLETLKAVRAEAAPKVAAWNAVRATRTA